MLANEAVFVAIIGGVATLTGIFLKGLWDLFQGRHERERRQETDRRDTITRYKEEAHEAHDRANREWEKARKHSIYAHTLQLFCIDEHGTDPRDFPKWPGD